MRFHSVLQLSNQRFNVLLQYKGVGWVGDSFEVLAKSNVVEETTYSEYG